MILDWKPVENYTALEQQVSGWNDTCVEYLHWAWEFLRRNVQFQEDFARHELYKHWNFQKHWILRPTDPAQSFSMNTGQSMLVMAMPSTTMGDLSSSKKVGKVDIRVNITGDWQSELKWIQKQIKEIEPRYAAAWASEAIADYEKNDYGAPLEAEVLKKIAQRIPDVTGNITKDQFPNYLRLLDANAADVSVTEMASTIIGTEFARDKTTIDSTRDQLTQAQRWRNGHYKLLISRALAHADPSDQDLRQKMLERASMDDTFTIAF